MTSRLFKKITEIAFFSLSLFVLNKILPTIIHLKFSQQEINNPKVIEYMNTQNYSYNYEGTDEKIALSYLKLANAITMSNITYKDYMFKKSDEELLKNKEGNCKETSRFTYANYLFLINNANKPKLKQYVRFASGTIQVKKDYYPHAWLEYSRNNNWIPYETTTNDFTDSIKIYPRLIDILIPDNTVLLPKEEYHPTSYHQIIQDGNLKRSINLEGIIKEKGLIYGLSKSFKLN